jgi:hypothetical protein
MELSAAELCAGSVRFPQARKWRCADIGCSATYNFAKGPLFLERRRGGSVAAQRSFYTSRSDTKRRVRRVVGA